ncbi:hypothetical protein Tco_0492466 [Tanacetum coccineum]
MGTKVTSSSGSVLEEPEIQKLQMQAKIFKENSLNKLNALRSKPLNFSTDRVYGIKKLLHDSLVIVSEPSSFSYLTLENLEPLLNAEQPSRDGFQITLCVIKLKIQQARFKRLQSSITSFRDETSSGIVSDEEY